MKTHINLEQTDPASSQAFPELAIMATLYFNLIPGIFHD